jgi:DNA repair protein RadC
VETTIRLQAAGELLAIQMIDHIIFRETGILSMVETGAIKPSGAGSPD